MSYRSLVTSIPCIESELRRRGVESVLRCMVPRLCSISFGVEPRAGPEVEKYSTPLMLCWIARCTSVWIRSGIDARSSVA